MFSLACSRNEYGNLTWYPPNVDGRFLKRSNGDWFAKFSWTPLTSKSTTNGTLQTHANINSKNPHCHLIMSIVQATLAT